MDWGAGVRGSRRPWRQKIIMLERRHLACLSFSVCRKMNSLASVDAQKAAMESRHFFRDKDIYQRHRCQILRTRVQTFMITDWWKTRLRHHSNAWDLETSQDTGSKTWDEPRHKGLDWDETETMLNVWDYKTLPMYSYNDTQSQRKPLWGPANTDWCPSTTRILMNVQLLYIHRKQTVTYHIIMNMLVNMSPGTQVSLPGNKLVGRAT